MGYFNGIIKYHGALGKQLFIQESLLQHEYKGTTLVHKRIRKWFGDPSGSPVPLPSGSASSPHSLPRSISTPFPPIVIKYF